VQKLRLTPKQVFLLYLLREVGPVDGKDRLQLGLNLAQERVGHRVYAFQRWVESPRSGELAQDLAFLRYQGLIDQEKLALTPLALEILPDALQQYDVEPMARVAAAFRATLAMPLAEVAKALEDL
jgi:hypothetical protein